jgi:UDP-hydrolysing UDP-N-acetyl-D-glucosamine 2-epimerase
MRTIGVVTIARSDYGIYLPILRHIEADPQLELQLLVSGMHLSPEFGMTIDSIEADGFRAYDRIEMLLSSDTPEGVAKAMGLGTIGFAQSYARNRPDILLVLGDRFEMHSAVTASIPFQIPVAHIHGGESTEGVNDQQFRHSITKMSHLHFVSTDTYRNRVVQMGEEPWRVTVCGAPALDNLTSLPLLDRPALEKEAGLDLSTSPLLVTYHPSILEPEDTSYQIGELLAALEESGLPVIFTYPNADSEGRLITQMIREFADWYDRCQIATNLGTQAYFSLHFGTRLLAWSTRMATDTPPKS